PVTSALCVCEHGRLDERFIQWEVRLFALYLRTLSGGAGEASSGGANALGGAWRSARGARGGPAGGRRVGHPWVGRGNDKQHPGAQELQLLFPVGGSASLRYYCVLKMTNAARMEYTNETEHLP
ncbi:hypothetical protein VaNZ11_014869, partial [Volvox africanus]